jgi:hypothetical protein
VEAELLTSASASQPKREYSLTEIMEEHCPKYLDAGMTYSDYWDGDAEMVIPYRKLLERRRKWENQKLWLQGKYFYDALVAVMPALSIKSKDTEIKDYIEDPYPLTEKEVKEQRKMAEKRHFEKMFAYMIERSKEGVTQKTTK